MTPPAARGRCWGGSIACCDCSDHIYQYTKFGACFQKCTNIVLSHWTITQSSHLSLGLPRLLLPCSRNSTALFGSMSFPIFQRILPTVVWSSPVSLSCSFALLSLALTPPFFSCTYALVTLAIFRTQLFSHTCSLCCCSSVIVRVSVPYSHARVTQVLTTLPLSLFEIRRSAITPQLLSTRSLRSVLFDAPLSPYSVSAHCPSYVHETVPLSQFLPHQLDVQLFPLVAYVQHFRLP